MGVYRKGSHTVHDVKYHYVWVTKYRYQILKGSLAYRIRDIIKIGPVNERKIFF